MAFRWSRISISARDTHSHVEQESAVDSDSQQFTTLFLGAVRTAPGVNFLLLRPVQNLLLPGTSLPSRGRRWPWTSKKRR